MRRVVCFVNRGLGHTIAEDLSLSDACELVAVVTNDPPNVDASFDSLRQDLQVLAWRDFSRTVAQGDVRFDAGVSALFRHRIPPDMLARFADGIVNLHPSLLPFGQGSHPATWAIWDQSPYGASAHLMTETIDVGPLIAQAEIEVKPEDSSFTLYEKGLKTLWWLYQKEVRPWASGQPRPQSAQLGEGSRHTSKDLAELRLLRGDPELSAADRERLRRALAMTLEETLALSSRSQADGPFNGTACIVPEGGRGS